MARNPLSPFRPGNPVGGGDTFLSLHREMNRLFDDFFRTGAPTRSDDRALGGAGAGQFVQAHMNVSETPNEIRITAELPGVTERDIDVSLEDDVLSIRGEKRFEESGGGEKESYHFVERSYGTFQRSIRLPFSVDPDQVQARFENGVLTITLPKTQSQERSRKIQIQAGAGSQSGRASESGGAAPQGMRESGGDAQGSRPNKRSSGRTGT